MCWFGVSPHGPNAWAHAQVDAPRLTHTRIMCVDPPLIAAGLRQNLREPAPTLHRHWILNPSHPRCALADTHMHTPRTHAIRAQVMRHVRPRCSHPFVCL